jgi:hypothetical protein
MYGVTLALKKLGVATATFQMWIRLYQANGPAALLPNKNDKDYSK